MIFHCPACKAGHSVPVSMIPNGGMPVTCRRCERIFQAVLPSEGDDEPTPLPTLAEATAIGVANPFGEMWAPMAPDGSVYGAEDNTEAAEEEEAPTRQGMRHDVPTRPIATGPNVPLGPDELGIDPERDDTVRVDVESDGRGIPPLPVGLPHRTTTPSVYDRLEAGEYVPEPSRSASGVVPVMKAWNEPSRVVDVGTGPVALLRRVAQMLNDAPLAVKVALLVFPLTLGLTLVWTARESARPTPALAAAAETSTRPPSAGAAIDDEAAALGGGTEVQRRGEAVRAGLAGSKGADGASEIEPTQDGSRAQRRGAAGPAGLGPAEGAASIPPAGPAFEDVVAPDGFAYVLADDARVTSRAARKATVVGRPVMGQRVRRYPGPEGWSLVSVEPAGPAGFLPDALLGVEKPVAALAREIAFSDCRAGAAVSVDDCLYGSKHQEDVCLVSCGPITPGRPDPRTLRCVEACSIAFETCARGCREETGRRRRRR